MLPLRYDSFDNDYICGKGDSSRLTVCWRQVGTVVLPFCKGALDNIRGAFFRTHHRILLYYNNIQMDNELHKLHYWAYIVKN